MKKSCIVTCCIGILFLNSCGGGENTPQHAATSVDVAQKSRALNVELNGYEQHASVATLFEKKNSQNLADVLFVFLLKEQHYFPSIAYSTYKQLSLGTLTQEAFQKQFVLDFVTYNPDNKENLLTQMLAALHLNGITLTKPTQRTRKRSVNASIAIPKEMLRGRKYNVYSSAREFTLSINEALSQASAKSGFFTLNLNLQLQDNILYSSSSQGDLKMWLEYPARQNDAGEGCLCVHSQDSSGKDMGLSYFFSEKLSIKNLQDAEQKCLAYPQRSSGDTPLCTEELRYLRNPVTGVCQEFHNSCEAQESHWDEVCSINDVNDTKNDDNVSIVIDDMNATHINKAMIEAYKIALESNKLSIEILELASEHKELADLLLLSLQQGVFNEKIVPQLSQNKLLGEAFLELMKTQHAVGEYVFKNLNAKSYLALMKSLMFSQKASLLFSQILANKPEYLAEGGSLERLIFDLADEDSSELQHANEMFFSAMFSSSEAVKNMLDAVDSLGSDLKYRYLDFIFLGKLEGQTTHTTQQYYNLSAIAEGMVVGMKTEPGEELLSFSYTTKLVGYFLTAITPSRYLEYGKALYSAGTDYLAKVDSDNLKLFKDAMSNPVVQLENNTTLQETTTQNDASKLYGQQYDTKKQSVEASMQTQVQKEQLVLLDDYETKKKATSVRGDSFFTFIPAALKKGAEVVPVKDEDVMDVTVKKNTQTSFFLLAPLGTQLQQEGLKKVADTSVESVEKRYDVFHLDTTQNTQLAVDKTKDMHLIAVPW